ncbi:pyrimidine dimer DNA glycosylase/endonuclease V [Georgenia sp. TF02-10]|uniref:pyrimidine dimer DNA glycosylase/endonuclease V n=1 Tax=Georgenia sp. TF02-10 TaxID=2917725 RepID=UPI001FA7169B|nr:pyrimidine dimer DNA glycosylase/endonuclease V [Georgenia sp. TF02-10]UNX54807.1 pyrimidine dimer DNA glycosylase/endonuclease V [Georgenia sp. TF02-10]
MRLWSLHPRYLDRQGLTACWREALLAQAVLAGRTRGYRQHSQLRRFRGQPDPLAAVGAYLGGVAAEAAARGYRFDTARILRPAVVAGGPEETGTQEPSLPLSGRLTPAAGGGPPMPGGVLPQAPAPASQGGLPVRVPPVPVTAGQVAHEWAHLMAKLAVRSPDLAAAHAAVHQPAVHPLFVVVPGPVEPWERSADG